MIKQILPARLADPPANTVTLILCSRSYNLLPICQWAISQGMNVGLRYLDEIQSAVYA